MKQIVGMLALLFFVTSCGVFSNDFSGGGIQKRKYTKGFYVNKRGSLKGAKDDVNAQKLEEVASDETSSDENSEGFVNVSNELVSDQVATQKEAHAQQVTSQTENKAKKKAVVTRPKKETRTSATSNHRKLREPEYYMPITYADYPKERVGYESCRKFGSDYDRFVGDLSDHSSAIGRCDL